TSWFNFINADAAVRTGKALAEVDRLASDHVDCHQSFRQIQHGLNGIRQSLFDSRLYHKPVYNDLNIVFDIFFQTDLFCQLVHISIDTYPDIPALFRFIQKLGVSSLSASYHRCKKLDFGTLRKAHNLIRHLIHRLLFDFLSTVRTVRNSNPRIEETEIIIDLRNGSYR